jgi:hypothetical protein
VDAAEYRCAREGNDDSVSSFVTGAISAAPLRPKPEFNPATSGRWNPAKGANALAMRFKEFIVANWLLRPGMPAIGETALTLVGGCSIRRRRISRRLIWALRTSRRCAQTTVARKRSSKLRLLP